MKEQSKQDKIATKIFRVLIGCIGIGILVLTLKKGSDDIFWTGIAISGLFIGYGLGGDKLGSILYNLSGR